MNKNVTNAALGIAAVVLAYAAYTRLKPPVAKPGTARIAPVAGSVYSGTAPGAYLSTDDLIYNVVNGNPYGDYASTDDLIAGVAYGGNAPDSIKLPGFWGTGK